MLSQAVMRNINSWSNTIQTLVPYFPNVNHIRCRCQYSFMLRSFAKRGRKHLCEDGEKRFASYLASLSFNLSGNELLSKGQSSSPRLLCCFKPFPFETFPLLLICFTEPFLAFNVLEPRGRFVMLVSVRNKYNQDHDQHYHRKAEFCGEPDKEREDIPPSWQEEFSFKALREVLILEYCRFSLNGALGLRAFLVMKCGMEV